jgi:cytochrome c oxidase subunit II
VKTKMIAFVVAVGAAISAGLYLLFTKAPMMPVAASVQAGPVDSAWNTLLVIECVIYAVMVAFILFCVVAFRAKNRDERGERFSSSRGYAVEAVWIIGSIALTLGLAAMGTQELRALIRDPEADIDVEVRAQQFSWEFYYPKFQTDGSRLFMEVGKRHRIILTSKDVVHAFWVPEFRVKQDAVPGKVIPLIITPTKTGIYTLLCNQLCGTGHTDMQGVVEVLEHEDFEKAINAEF